MFKKRNSKSTQENVRLRRNISSSDYDHRRYLYHSVSIDRLNDSRKNLAESSKPTSTEITNKNISDNKQTPSNQKTYSFFKFWFKRILVLIILSGIIVAAIRLDQLSGQINVTSTNSQLDPIYSKIIETELSKSFLNKNKILINQHQIFTALKSKYPDITSVNFKLSFFSQILSVDIQTSPATIFFSTNYNAGLINDQGRVVDTSILSNDPNLIILNDAQNIELRAGDYVLNESIIGFINTVNYQLTKKNITVSHYIITSSNDELDAYIKNTSYYVKFNLVSNDPLNQSGTFLATYHYLTTNNIKPSSYVDVRIDGRAYYK